MTEDELRQVLDMHMVGNTAIDDIMKSLRARGSFASPDLRKTRAEAEEICRAVFNRTMRVQALPSEYVDALWEAGFFFFAAPALPDGLYRCEYTGITGTRHRNYALQRTNGRWMWQDGTDLTDQSAVRPIARLTETPL